MTLRILFFLLISFLFACQGNQDRSSISLKKTVIKGGKKCGVTRGSFLGSWFDYYERALSFADCEMWTESEKDLKKALSKRSVDKRRVYSLGMHLVSDYFPHRELGVALFYQKKYSTAKKQLDISLSQFPTTKAEEYLKRIRQINISNKNSNKKNKDTLAPIIQVNSPQFGQMMNSSEVTVSGLVSDNHFIDSLTINGIAYRYIPSFVSKSGIPIRVARKVPKMDFKLTVPVKVSNGKGLIRIVASDLAGNRSIKEIPILMDQQGPQISIKTLEKKNQDYHIVLNISDQRSKIKHLEINNKKIAIKSKAVVDKKTKEKIEEVYIDKLIGGPFDKEHLLIFAVDDTGNNTRANIRLDKTLRDEKKTLIHETSAAAPKIYLAKDEEQRITLEKIAYIEGEVESDSLITSLSINGKNVLNSAGKHIYFNYRAELKEGLNNFTLIAKNKQNKEKHKAFRIVRKLPPNRSLKERLKIAQFPFPCNVVSRSPCFVSASFYDQLYGYLKSRKRFQITDQTQLNQLLDETGSCEDGVSDECVVKIADQLVNKNIWQAHFSNAMFAGSVIERTNIKGQVSIEIAGRMINSKTREVMTSVDIYAENIKKKQFRSFAQNMVTEISDAFPLLDGKVTQQISSNKLQVNLSEKDRIWEQMPVLVYQHNNKKNCGNGDLVDIGEAASFVWYTETLCNNNQPQLLHVITR